MTISRSERRSNFKIRASSSAFRRLATLSGEHTTSSSNDLQSHLNAKTRELRAMKTVLAQVINSRTGGVFSISNFRSCTRLYASLSNTALAFGPCMIQALRRAAASHHHCMCCLPAAHMGRDINRTTTSTGTSDSDSFHRRGVEQRPSPSALRSDPRSHAPYPHVASPSRLRISCAERCH